jgi:hypothetical protein
MKKYEDLIRPVMTKMYAEGAAGAPEGMMPGTMPEGMPKPDSHFTSSQGPKVEEVD